MAEWISFFIVCIEEGVNWLATMQIMGVPLAGIIVASFIISVMVRAILLRA